MADVVIDSVTITEKIAHTPAAASHTAETVVRVEASGAYDVVVGRGLLDEVGTRLRAAVPACDDAVLIVTDSNVGPLYGARVEQSLARAGFSPSTLVLSAGEPTKSLASLGTVLETAAASGLTRSSTVVALGGGVMGDLAGFAAATYMRGCHLVQVATSLLAMVDSSVGGKTAVDLPQGKNLAGAFYQPDLVLCDLDCLQTLPAVFTSDGTGEVVKYGVMADPELFGWLEEPVAGQEARVVARCVVIKRDVVEADEREGGVRKLLNLGHTVGHAIELLGAYRIPHGHAVAAGMAIMARACAAKGWCDAGEAERIEAMLAVHGLPTATRRDPDELVEAARHDKKRAGDRLDVVLVRGVGRSEVRRLTFDEFADLVRLGCAKTEGVRFAEDEAGAQAATAPVDAPAASNGRYGDDTRLVEGLRLDGSVACDAVVQPGPLAGTIPAIASKSAAHRMLICAALADAPTRITCTTTSQDIEATSACLRALGARVERDGDELMVEPVDVAAADGRPALLDCGESGSTLRFMLPVACALGSSATFDGRGRLPERPLEPLRSRLVEHGCAFNAPGTWPLGARGRLRGGVFDLPGNVSSQYVTGLLLALPLTHEGGTVRLHGTVESRPYIDMTVFAMQTFGVAVMEGREPGGEEGELVTFSVAAGARYTSPGAARVEGDWSNAAFWLAAGALSDEPVTVTGLDLASEQGDKGVLNVLAALGAYVATDPAAGTATTCGRDPVTGEERTLRGTVIDAQDVPDLIPVLSVVAACAQGETRVVNAARLRIKESDRLQTTAEVVCCLGAMADELPDGLVIHGRGDGLPAGACLQGCTLRAHGDHRIAMTASIAAGRASGPVVVDGAQAVAKSYPGFYEDLALLGGSCVLVVREGR